MAPYTLAREHIRLVRRERRQGQMAIPENSAAKCDSFIHRRAVSVVIAEYCCSRQKKQSPQAMTNDK